MDLKQIFAIKNYPGLYKAESKTKTGFIAASLTDAKRVPISDNTEAYCLDDITVFRTPEQSEKELKQIKHIPLLQVFEKMHKHEQPPVDAKAEPEVIKNYFFAVIPDIDRKRVFASDMKKIIGWYNLLKDKVSFGKMAVVH